MNDSEARDLLERLLRRIAPEADLEGGGEDEALQDVVDLDSMDMLNLMTALHEETGIEVPEGDYPQLSSISGFVGYVTARR